MLTGYLVSSSDFASTTLLSSIGDYSRPIISDLLPLALMFLGITFGILVIKWIATLFHR